MTKILLVEDDKSLREIYGVRLIAEGYEIVSAGDGEEALAIAIKERPDLIISDVMMPKISGFDMLDILRSTTETKDIKVIMMTALSSEDQRVRGESLGADRYLVKSQVGIEDVVRTVHDVLTDGVASPQLAAQTFGGAAASDSTAEPLPAPVPVPEPDTVSPVASAAPTPELEATPAPLAEPEPAPTLEPVAPLAAEVPAPAELSVPAAEPELPPMPEPAPVAPAPQPAPAPLPPIINMPPAVPAPTPAPVPAEFQPDPNPLPQPTAPFSSNRPDSLGDRIIHPLNEPSAPVDMASLMSQELSSAEEPVVAPAPVPEPTPVVAPAPEEPSQPTPQV